VQLQPGQPRGTLGLHLGSGRTAAGRVGNLVVVNAYPLRTRAQPDAPAVVFQPVLCMHCEKAPCEYVCPMHATTHSSEGINEMTYNRCIGTRDCSQNCPYKVRRFNFLSYTGKAALTPATIGAHSPDVSVRSRGVMEKCTYCVQRINRARIAAQKDGRRIQDDDFTTACAEAMTIFAVLIAGSWPILHLGRPWFFYWLIPYPSTMGVWPQFRSAQVWNFFAVSPALSAVTMSTRAYFSTYIALLLLLAATVWSHNFELGAWNSIINLTIATTKVVLIALIFMELIREISLIRIFSLIGLGWLAILFTLVLAEYFGR